MVVVFTVLQLRFLVLLSVIVGVTLHLNVFISVSTPSCSPLASLYVGLELLLILCDDLDQVLDFRVVNFFVCLLESPDISTDSNQTVNVKINCLVALSMECVLFRLACLLNPQDLGQHLETEDLAIEMLLDLQPLDHTSQLFQDVFVQIGIAACLSSCIRRRSSRLLLRLSRCLCSPSKLEKHVITRQHFLALLVLQKGICVQSF